MKDPILFTQEKSCSIKIHITLLFLITVLLSLPHTAYAAEKQTVYKENNYHYIITNEDKKEVTLIGYDATEVRKELQIPGTVHLNNQEYSVAHIDIRWDYYENSAYKNFYDSVNKLTFAETFHGTVDDPLYAFTKVRTIEFKGTEAPAKVNISLSNRSLNPDVVFIVPKGSETAYRKVIQETISYYNGSDLYEMEIPMTPTMINHETDQIENGTFAKNGLLYQVTSSAKKGLGKVQLIGITNERKHSYLNLPKEIKNNGYTYQLAKLCKFSLVRIGATVIIIPDSVTQMEASVFDRQVELLFLSKNCKVIPSYMITDENGESNLRFVYVPEGVTTISEKAFSNIRQNDSSIILPTTIKSLGKQSLYSFKYVTFLNNKPIAKISSAIKTGSTVKVNATVKSAYQKALGTKISLISAKNVVKSTKLTLNRSSLTLNTGKSYLLKGTLSKSSNETVFWLSSDTKIFGVSSKGMVTAKKSGTAYAIAYTRTSGLIKAVKVTVTAK